MKTKKANIKFDVKEVVRASNLKQIEAIAQKKADKERQEKFAYMRELLNEAKSKFCKKFPNVKDTDMDYFIFNLIDWQAI